MLTDGHCLWTAYVICIRIVIWCIRCCECLYSVSVLVSAGVSLFRRPEVDGTLISKNSLSLTFVGVLLFIAELAVILSAF